MRSAAAVAVLASLWVAAAAQAGPGWVCPATLIPVFTTLEFTVPVPSAARALDPFNCSQVCSPPCGWTAPLVPAHPAGTL